LILNFGTLDLMVQDYLENHLSPEEFAKFKECSFAERIKRIQKHVQQSGFPAVKREPFEQWSRRLESIRETRNHIAHGLLRLALAEDKKTWFLAISLPRDLDGSNSPATRHLSLDDLLRASKELTDSTEEFREWSGTWVTDLDIKI
jgi:hypothetical protein